MRSLGTFLTLVTLLVSVPALGADTARTDGPRVRPADGRVAALLLDGLDRSPTIRALVDRIEAGNVIAYVELEPALRNTRYAGMLRWVTATPHHRYVRVSLNPELTRSLIVSTLAHELQHVLEVVDSPSVVDAASLSDLYRRIGHQKQGRHHQWDTTAAIDTGFQVRRELAAARPPRLAESLHGLDPIEWYVLYRRMPGAAPPAGRKARTALETP